MVRQLNNVSRTVIFLLILVVGIVFSTTANVDAATNYYPATVKNVKAVSSGHDAVKVTWGKTARADGYKVYRATAKNGKYSLVKTTTARSFTNTKLKANKTYYYKVKAYNKVKVKGKTKTYLSKKFSSKVYAKPILAAPTVVKTKATAYNKAYISWNAGKNAKGYIVYRATSKTGKYVKIKTTTARNFTDTVKTGKAYYYKIRSYNVRSGKYQYSGYSKAASVKTTLGYSTKITATISDDSVIVKWTAVPGATKYVLHRDDGTRVTVTGTSYTDKTANDGNYYSYCVRALRDGVYGDWSEYSNDICIIPEDDPIIDPDEPTEDEEVVTPDEPTEPSDPTTPSEPSDGEEDVTTPTDTEDGTTDDDSSAEDEGTTTPTEPEDGTTDEEVVTPSEPTTPSEPAEDEEVSEPGYIMYNKDGNSSNATKLYIGQEWSDSLNAALNGGTPVEKLLTRSAARYNGISEDVYCYDTVDFDNFLIVYVKENRVIAWQTNAKVLGAYDGVELVQGTPRSEYSQFPEFKYYEYGGSGPYIPSSTVESINISKGDIYFGGIVEDSYKWDTTISSDLVAEELLCEYTVNAFRVMNGLSILSHNEYIYGDGSTYGTKAWSATQAASETQSHGILPEGPLANIEINDRNSLVYTTTKGKVVVGNENVATNYSGEFVVDAWFNSAIHSGALMVTAEPQDCYPTSIHAGAVAKGDNGLYYWTWHNGNFKIDYGIGTPVVEVVSVTDTTATLQWTDVLSEHGSSAYRYQVEFYTDAECTTGRKGAETIMNPYTRKSLVAGTTYYYRVRAGITVDGSQKWGEWSEVGSFTTTASTTE